MTDKLIEQIKAEKEEGPVEEGVATVRSEYLNAMEDRILADAEVIKAAEVLASHLEIVGLSEGLDCVTGPLLDAFRQAHSRSAIAKAKGVRKMEVGRLKELYVKPGDVVQVIGGKSWEITGMDKNGNYLINDPPARHLSNTMPFRIISRASDSPKLWRDMTDAEKGALLLAHHEGKVIEAIDPTDPEDIWECHTEFDDHYAYRIKPEPMRDTVTLYGRNADREYSQQKANLDTHIITFDLIDGEPDCLSIKMEKL